MRVGRLVSIAGFVVAASIAPPGAANPVTITVDTSAFIGTDAVLAFDFTNGSGTFAPNAVAINSVTLGNLVVLDVNNAVVTATSITSGSASLADSLNTDTTVPTLDASVTFWDSDFLVQYQQPIHLASRLSFTVDATSNPDSPAPDQLAFFLLDSTGFGSLVTTNDLFGANALFVYTLGDADQPTLLDVVDDSGTTIAKQDAGSVPEPASLLLIAAAMLGVIASRAPRIVSRV